jgi:hypothetical protein
MTLFPLALVLRATERLTGRHAVGSDGDLRVPVAPLNAALDAALRIEWVAMHVINLPIGTSLLCLARKPA